MHTLPEVSLLFVENDPLGLELCSRIIARSFPQMLMHTTSTLESARAIFESHGHDIVISTLFGESRDSMHLIHEICARKPNVIVFLVSGNTDIRLDTLHPEDRHLPIKAVLHKPLDAIHLIQSITEAVATITKQPSPNIFPVSH